jgi:DNA-directed RNA polymerase subunit RPC12/RpoP
MCLFVGHVFKKVYYVLIFGIYVKRVKTMPKNFGSMKTDEEDCSLGESQTDFTCGTCGDTFRRPILATVSSSGYTQRYYACPRCMVKVRDIKTQENEGESDRTTLTRGSKKPSAMSESDVKCDHFLGYLKKRQKDTPIPDECLMCGKMIECLVH